MKTINIVSNLDITNEFNLKCFYRSPGVLLKRTKLYTHQLDLEFAGVKVSALVQVDDTLHVLQFLN